jgi:predicted dienelactone hydrolase
MKRHIAILLTLAMALATAPLQAGEVVSAETLLHDAARNRDVPIKAYFPSGGGPYPLVIFSHGYGGSREGYRYLAESWAAAGYVVILPTHLGSDTTVLKHKGLRELRDPSNATDLFKQVSLRPGDVSFVIDSLDALHKAVPALAGKMDPGRIGVAGHSMGAGTSMYLAGGVMVRSDGGRQTFADPRVRAFIAISPQGPGEEGFTKDSWNDIHAPFMAMVGSADKGVNGEPADWRLGVYEHLPPGDKYSVLVPGANHMSFADHIRGVAGLLATRGQTLDVDTLHAEVERLTLLFWDAYLKSDGAAHQQLLKGVSYQPACTAATCPVVQSK